MSEIKLVQKQDRCEPQVPCPQPVPEEPCVADVELTGKLTMECCCPQLHSRTFIVNIGPQSEPALRNYLQNTVSAWEAGGYIVLAHSLIDTGAGWQLGLTVGWYA